MGASRMTTLYITAAPSLPLSHHSPTTLRPLASGGRPRRRGTAAPPDGCNCGRLTPTLPASAPPPPPPPPPPPLPPPPPPERRLPPAEADGAEEAPPTAAAAAAAPRLARLAAALPPRMYGSQAPLREGVCVCVWGGGKWLPGSLEGEGQKLAHSYPAMLKDGGRLTRPGSTYHDSPPAVLSPIQIALLS